MSNLIIADGAVPTVGGKALWSTTAITPSSSANSNSAKLLTHDDKVLIAQNGKGLEAPAVPVVDPYDITRKILSSNLEYFKLNIPDLDDESNFIWAGTAGLYCGKNIKFISLMVGNIRIPQYAMTAPSDVYNLRYAHFGRKMVDIGAGAFNNQRNLKSLIFHHADQTDDVVKLINSTAMTNSGIALGTGYLYVPDQDLEGNDLPEKYKTATNWSKYSSQIKGYSEAPAYNTSTQYGIGDVCQYSGKFYGYCKEDLQPATGHAPSGTAEDNEYWEYIDDIEVSA